MSVTNEILGSLKLDLDEEAFHFRSEMRRYSVGSRCVR